MNHRAVFERDFSASQSFLITETDLKAVESVARYRLILGDQLRQLHWPRPTQRRHAESRLRGLFHSGWLDRIPLMDGFARPRAIYTLGRLGRSHVARLKGVPLSSLGPRPVKERRHDLLFIKHHLMTVQAVLNLELAARAAGGDLQLYRDDRYMKAYRAQTNAIPVIPDAFVHLDYVGHVQSFCIELDRATVDLRAWQARILSYLQWTKMDSYKDTFRRPFVLVIVEAEGRIAERRLRSLKATIEKVAATASADPSLFLLASLAEADSASILCQPVWAVAGREEPLALMR